MEELFIEPVKANIYVISTLTPRALGYDNIMVEAGQCGAEGFPVAMSFTQQNLNKNQREVLADLGSHRIFEEIAKRLRVGSDDDVRRLLIMGFEAQAIGGGSLTQLTYQRFKKQFKEIHALRPDTQKKFLKDLSIYLDNMIEGANPKRSEPIKQEILAAFLDSLN